VIGIARYSALMQSLGGQIEQAADRRSRAPEKRACAVRENRCDNAPSKVPGNLALHRRAGIFNLWRRPFIPRIGLRG
jgi:hypothetical protein